MQGAPMALSGTLRPSKPQHPIRSQQSQSFAARSLADQGRREQNSALNLNFDMPAQLQGVVQWDSIIVGRAKHDAMEQNKQLQMPR